VLWPGALSSPGQQEAPLITWALAPFTILSLSVPFVASVPVTLWQEYPGPGARCQTVVRVA
jgi:hypothetical protein